MEFVHNIEKTTEVWFKDLPHLPANFTKWLADNSWWLALIGVILGAFGLLGTLGAIGAGSALLTAVGGPALGGTLLIGSLVSIAFGAASLVVEVMAITPLKTLQKKGWDLIFLSVLISIAGGVVSAVLGMNIASLLMTAVAAAISGYFLFELRSHYK